MARGVAFLSQFLLSDCIIVPSLEVAQELKYGEPASSSRSKRTAQTTSLQRYRFVTLDGEKLQRGGIISLDVGGLTGRLVARWEAEEQIRLLERVERVKDQLQTLDNAEVSNGIGFFLVSLHMCPSKTVHRERDGEEFSGGAWRVGAVEEEEEEEDGHLSGTSCFSTRRQSRHSCLSRSLTQRGNRYFAVSSALRSPSSTRCRLIAKRERKLTHRLPSSARSQKGLFVLEHRAIFKTFLGAALLLTWTLRGSSSCSLSLVLHCRPVLFILLGIVIATAVG